MSASDFDIRHIAHLARIRLTEDEIATYADQIARIIAYVEKLGELPVDEVPPTSHPLPVQDVMRDDLSVSGLDVEDALANAPERSGDHQFIVPKVVD